VLAQGAEQLRTVAAHELSEVAPVLAPGVSLPLSSQRVTRTVSVASAGVLRFTADRGVCAFLKGDEVMAVEGTGKGCTLERVVEPGSYRLVVRAFASEPLSGSARWVTEPVGTATEGVSPEATAIVGGETRFFRFTTKSAGRVGVGLQVPADLLECRVLDAAHRVLGEGCQQLLALEQGSYLLAITAPDTTPAVSFRPVLVGLQGARADVPEDYLRELFQRIGAQP
jgi:hypothetical protein